MHALNIASLIASDQSFSDLAEAARRVISLATPTSLLLTSCAITAVPISGGTQKPGTMQVRRMAHRGAGRCDAFDLPGQHCSGFLGTATDRHRSDGAGRQEQARRGRQRNDAARGYFAIREALIKGYQ